MKRTFIAAHVDVGSELLHLTGILKHEFVNDRINWVDPGNFHVTLRFLGDTPDDMIHSVSGIIREIAGTFRKSNGRLEGLDTFSHNRMPSVLFSHLVGLPVLNEIAGFIGEKIQPTGFQTETKTFKPHLTLARIKHLRDIDHFSQAIRKLSPSFFQDVAIEKVIWYESILSSAGPEYKSLETVILNN